MNVEVEMLDTLYLTVSLLCAEGLIHLIEYVFVQFQKGQSLGTNLDTIYSCYFNEYMVSLIRATIWFPAYSLLLTTTPYCLLPTAYSLLPTPYCLLPTAYSLLPTPYCLLPTAYSLLPTPYCLLPTAYSLLLTHSIHSYQVTSGFRDDFFEFREQVFEVEIGR
jgi:hypothetical protein